jgi:hypothetical protein
MLRNARQIVVGALLLAAFAHSPAAAAPGAVTLVRTAGDAPAAAEQAFLRTRVWRLHGTTAWNLETTWIRRSALALDAATAAAHPEWVLKDSFGRPLYFGSAPAADLGSPDYRAWWIAEAVAAATGARGLYVDDVTMERRTTLAWGSRATPRDPRTGASMSETTWQRYMADFMDEVRAALPAAEIVHDVLWSKGSGNSNLRRQLAAADHVAIERGFNDPAIVYGGGRTGWQSLAAFAEARQSAGRGVILDGYADTQQGRLYGLATYLLVDLGATALGNDAATAPAAFWSGYDVQLGPPTAGRWPWSGVWRRDFANGLVLVNEPGTATRTIAVPPGYAGLDGVERTTVTLAAASGMVLVKTPAPPTAPPPTPSPAPTPPAVAPPPAVGPVSTPKPGSGSAGRSSGKLTARISGARGPAATRTIAGLSASRVYGRVRGAVSGTVRVTVQRRRGNRWTTVRQTRATVTRSGAYERAIPRLPRGSYRVAARFEGTGTALPSRSSYSRRAI